MRLSLPFPYCHFEAFFFIVSHRSQFYTQKDQKNAGVNRAAQNTRRFTLVLEFFISVQSKVYCLFSLTYISLSASSHTICFPWLIFYLCILSYRLSSLTYILPLLPPIPSVFLDLYSTSTSSLMTSVCWLMVKRGGKGWEWGSLWQYSFKEPAPPGVGAGGNNSSWVLGPAERWKEQEAGSLCDVRSVNRLRYVASRLLRPHS